MESQTKEGLYVIMSGLVDDYDILYNRFIDIGKDTDMIHENPGFNNVLSEIYRKYVIDLGNRCEIQARFFNEKSVLPANQNLIISKDNSLKAYVNFYEPGFTKILWINFIEPEKYKLLRMMQ